MTERLTVEINWLLDALEEAHKEIQGKAVLEFQYQMLKVQLIGCYVTIAALIGILILEKMK